MLHLPGGGGSVYNDLGLSQVSVGLYRTYIGPRKQGLRPGLECTIGLLYSYILLAKNVTGLYSPRIELDTSLVMIDKTHRTRNIAEV